MIIDDWLSPEKHPEMPDLSRPAPLEEMPTLLRLSPHELTRELQGLNPGYRMVLGTAGLSVEDATELLWDCRGAITHLEIFNMKGWMEGRLTSIAAIGELRAALNLGLGPRVKQMVRRMIRHMENKGEKERATKFQDILRNVPKLWEHYRHNPLKSRLGTVRPAVSLSAWGWCSRKPCPGAVLRSCGASSGIRVPFRSARR